MKWSPWLSVVLATALLAPSSGCLFTHHTTNVVRKNEKPRAVVFESPQAKNIFDGKLVEVKANLSSMSNPKVVAVPFVLWWSSTEVVSDNGVYNDQVAICDTNGDGVITLDEASIYAAKVDEKIAKQNAERAKIEASVSPNQPPATPTVTAQPVSTQQPSAVRQSSYTSPQAPLPPGNYR